MKYSLSALAFFLLLGIATTTVNATTTIVTESCSITRSRLDWRIDPSTSTNTVKDCVINQFDSSLGELKTVTLTAKATTDTVQKMENKDVSPHTMNSSVTVDLHLKNTTSTQNIITLSIPAANATLIADAFDGTLDYAGTSGKSFDVEYANDTNTVSYTSSADTTQFIGTGSLTFPVYAIATWSCTGSGNAECGVDTYASAAITVTYEYIIPEPDLIINTCTTQIINNDSTDIYPIRMANQGNANINGEIVVTGTFPSCLSYVRVESAMWKCTVVTVSGKDAFTCTFTGLVPKGASVPELPIKVKAHGCTNLTDSYIISAKTNGETVTTNNSLTCSVGIGTTKSPDVDNIIVNTPTPTSTVTNQNPGDNSTLDSSNKPGVLSSNTKNNTQNSNLDNGDVLGVLASTGMIIAVPAVIGTALVGLVYLTRRKKHPSDKE